MHCGKNTYFPGSYYAPSAKKDRACHSPLAELPRQLTHQSSRPLRANFGSYKAGRIATSFFLFEALFANAFLFCKCSSGSRRFSSRSWATGQGRHLQHWVRSLRHGWQSWVPGQRVFLSYWEHTNVLVHRLLPERLL